MSRQSEIDKIDEIMKKCPLGDAGKKYLATHLVGSGVGTKDRFYTNNFYDCSKACGVEPIDYTI